MKKFLKLMMTLSAAALLFAGCSSDGGSSGGQNTPQTPSQPAGPEEVKNWTVSFDVNGGVEDAEKFAPQTVKDGEKAVNPGYPEKEHYHVPDAVSGWSTVKNEKASAYDFETPVKADTKLYALWDIDQHTVSFDLNGAEGEVPSQIVDWNTEITLPAIDEYTKVVDGKAATCLGWALRADAESGFTGNVTVTEDVTYYLAWTTKEVFEVTFNVGDTVYNTATVVDGGKVTAPTDPVKEGYEFAGWLINNVAAYDFDTPVTAPIELKANWRIVEYQITYEDSKDGTVEGLKKEVYTINDTVELCRLEKAGYTFNGWKKDGETVISIPAGTTGNITLTADWTPIEYTITYVLNGGTNAASNPDKYTVEDSVTFVPATKDRYAFGGWEPASIAEGSTGNVTVTATWLKIPVTSVTVTGPGTVKFGGTAKLTATVTPANATETTVIWTCTSGANIDSDGNLSAGSTEGLVTVTAACDGKEGSAEINIIDPAKIETVSITNQGGWLESSFVEWAPAANYNSFDVYVQKSGTSTWTKLDDQLIRSYAATAGGSTVDHWRADALGLAAGTYTMKVVGVDNDGAVEASAAISTPVEVKAHDRSGFAFTGTTTPGAYNADGTLKNNALVIYLTENTKETVKADITTSAKGAKTSCTGILEIALAIKKGYETRPVAVRVLGTVGGWSELTSDKNFKGDLCFETGDSKAGFTIEGVGEDATANDWGIRFKNAQYCEARNLGFVNCSSDEGDNLGLQQDNEYIWVHNCDMFYGNAGSDKDQVKGDGALDCKGSNYVTFSYNHFWDNGKCNLLGLSEGVKSYDDNAFYITYHHNWYDHSDSRHPRARFYNAHVYNNYYDGNAKYGIGAAAASSIFAESNFFRNVKYPMMAAMQGTDIFCGGTAADFANGNTFSSECAGVIKAYNNHLEGTYTFIPYGATKYIQKGSEVSFNLTKATSTTDFDAYVVTDKSAKVPVEVKANQNTTLLAGKTLKNGVAGNYYSNFDTASTMYSYTADEPAAAKEKVVAYAGRMNGGDIKYTFNNSVEDTNYIVIAELKSMVTNYKTKIVAIQGDGQGGTSGGEGGEDPVDPVTPGTPSITLKASATSVTEGGTVTITVTPANFTATPSYTFTSSDISKATVDGSGKVTAVAAGSVTITVTATNGGESASKTIAITVNAKQTEITPSGLTYPATPLKAGTYSAGFAGIGFELIKGSTSSAIADKQIDVYAGAYLTFKVNGACTFADSTVGNKGLKIVKSDGTVILEQGTSPTGFSVELDAGDYYIIPTTGVSTYTRLKPNITVTYK